MNDHNCINCNTPLPFSISSLEVECSTCGEKNKIHSLAQGIVKEKTAKKLPPQKSLFRKIISGIFTIIGFVVLVFLGAERLGYDLKGYFSFTVVAPQKTEITANDIYDFSQNGVAQLLQRFKAQLTRLRWLESAATRSKLNQNQIKNCINDNVKFDQVHNVWVVEFWCETDFKDSSAGIDIAKELNSRFSLFLKANKSINKDIKS